MPASAVIPEQSDKFSLFLFCRTLITTTDARHVTQNKIRYLSMCVNVFNIITLVNEHGGWGYLGLGGHR